MKRFTSLLALFVLAGFQFLQAQSVQITGNVTSTDDGAPLPGVSVVVKGTTIGTVTDFDGNYSLAVPSSSNTLVFSFIGMKTQELAISGQTIINLALEPDIVGLDEVVITAIGIKRAEKALGYSVQTVNTENIVESGSANIVNALNAKTSGVQITSSAGDAGAATHVTIRGSASILGNNEPLWVVDGLPISSGGGGGQADGRVTYGNVDGVTASSRSIDLNPDDIESISVLKGGAATALYGLRAANGVIVVTTKKGTTGKALKVDFHTRFGIEKISQVEPMQRQYAQGNNGLWVPGFQRSFGPNVDTLQYDTTTDPDYKWDSNGRIVGQSNPNANGKPVQTYDAYDFFQTGTVFDNTLSVSAGSEKSTYYFSVSDLEQKGIIPNNKFARTSIRLNAETNLTSKIKVGTNVNYINSRSNQVQKGSNVSGIMLGLVRTSPTFDNSAGYEFPDGTQRDYRGAAGGAEYDNPYWAANKISFDDNVNRFMGNTTFSYNITDWINLYYNAGIDWYTRTYKDVFAVHSNQYPDGYVGEYSWTGGKFNGDLLLNFNRDFGDVVKASLTLGHNMYADYGKYVFGDADGLSIIGFYDVSNTASQTTNTYEENYHTMAVFGDLSLDIMSMIFVDLTGRNDWSTTMPKANKSAFYPSASIGFVLTELPGLKNNNILPFAKIRASWARTANIAAPYNTKTLYEIYNTGDGWVTTGVTSPFLGYSGFELDENLGNPDLKHETMTSTEVGADLRFYNNRLGLDFGYFYNKNTDLLLDVPIAASSGFQSVYKNAATMESKGIEITLKATPVVVSGFSWDIMANFTKMKNTVLELAPGVEDVFLGGFTVPQMRAVAGQEYGSMFGFDWYRDENGRILVNDNPSDAYPDGYPMPDERLMVPIGNVNPDWLLNITNTFSYKGISLSGLLDIKRGGDQYNGTAFAMNYLGTTGRTVTRDVVYTPEGTIDFDKTPAGNIVVFDGVYGHVDATGAPVSSGLDNVSPVVLDENWLEGFGSNFGGGPSWAAIERADWVRLREITLSYSFPKSLLGKTFSNLQIYFTGRNLYLWTPYSGIDPETNLEGNVNSQGFDYFNNPGTKSYNFGLRVSF
jgi:TonB-linked SusC/RagA family outer membrane protein